MPSSLVSRTMSITNMTNSSLTTTTTVSYDSLNVTDLYTPTTEIRQMRLPIEIQILMCLLYGTLAFTAITSNMIVCYIVLSNQRMRTATNYFIVNLAVGDILMALLCIPFTFPANLIFQYWPFGFSLCVIVSYSQANSVFVSAYTMVAISIDKYLAIVYPMRLRMTKIQAKIIILAIWSAALLTSLPTALLSSLAPAGPDFSSTPTTTGNAPTTTPKNVTPLPPPTLAPTLNTNKSQYLEISSSPYEIRLLQSNSTNPTSNVIPLPATQHETGLFRIQNPTTTQPTEDVAFVVEQQQEQRKYFCQESWSFWPQGKYYYSMALMILQFVLPLFVLVITYSRIVIIVWGKRMPGEEDNARDARMARSKRKMIKMVIFCVIAFALTWLPFNALIVIGDVMPDIWEHQNIMYIWFTTHYLAMCHTITNPLIYIWMNNRFRAGFKQVIEDLCEPIRRVLVYLWYYCCCFACAISCWRKKYSRVARDSTIASKANNNCTQLCLDGHQVPEISANNNNNNNNNANNNYNNKNHYNTNHYHHHQQHLHPNAKASLTEATVSTSPTAPAAATMTTSITGHQSPVQCSTTMKSGKMRCTLGGSSSTETTQTHYIVDDGTGGGGGECGASCKMQTLAAAQASAAQERRRQSELSNKLIQETVIDRNKEEEEKEEERKIMPAVVVRRSLPCTLVNPSSLASGNPSKKAQDSSGQQQPIRLLKSTTTKRTTFVAHQAEHRKHICRDCYKTIRTTLSLSEAGGKNDNDEQENPSTSSISSGIRNDKQQSRVLLVATNKHIRGMRKLPRASGDKCKAAQAGATQDAEDEQTNHRQSSLANNNNNNNGKKKKQRRKKQSHMISIQMTNNEYHHHQQANNEPPPVATHNELSAKANGSNLKANNPKFDQQACELAGTPTAPVAVAVAAVAAYGVGVEQVDASMA